MRKIQGVHLMVDGYIRNLATFQPDNILKMLDALVTALGMQYLTKPQHAEVELDRRKLGSDEDEGGTSFFCQITTSHIAVHTWPLRKAVMLDIFSCIPFDTREAFSILDEYLDFEYYSAHTVNRQDPKGCFCDGTRQTGDWEMVKKVR